MEDSMEQILSRIGELKDKVSEIPGPELPFVYHSEIVYKPIESAEDIERAFNIEIPPDLRVLWSKVNSIRLFEDINYGQWGLLIWSISETLRNHPKKIEMRGQEDFLEGDLIIGKFHGDLDLPIIRCNPSESDFGAVVIGLPIYPRQDWPYVGATLTEFLVSFIEADGDKYWEHRNR